MRIGNAAPENGKIVDKAVPNPTRSIASPSPMA
jgi:hypothetical protein